MRILRNLIRIKLPRGTKKVLKKFSDGTLSYSGKKKVIHGKSIISLVREREESAFSSASNLRIF